MNALLRYCRVVHGWLGALIMPWVVIIGFTGFYLNHESSVLGLLGYSELQQSDLDGLTSSAVDEALTAPIVTSIWPGEPVLEQGSMRYKKLKAWGFKKDSGWIIFPGPTTSFYVVRVGMLEQSFALDGRLINQHYNFPGLFKTLHEKGWFSNTFGTVMADVVALSMMLFGFSGLFLWSVPRVRRSRLWSSQRLSAH